MKSKGGKYTRNNLSIRFGLDNIVAIPFPILPRQEIYGESARMLDFIDWKQRSIIKTGGKVDPGANMKSVEELEKLSQAELQIGAIRMLLKMYDSGDREGLLKVYKILCDKSPDSA